jgi:hypothetical protein
MPEKNKLFDPCHDGTHTGCELQINRDWISQSQQSHFPNVLTILNRDLLREGRAADDFRKTI